ncbi:hypothetical protein OROGR_010124 [Orobanche gracilis]
MQQDEVIWQVIRHNHCSFMAKIESGLFCRNLYNVTGICNQSSCPLANSPPYANTTLYMKTIERAHMPNRLWERVKLPRNCEMALEIIDKHLPSTFPVDFITNLTDALAAITGTQNKTEIN